MDITLFFIFIKLLFRVGGGFTLGKSPLLFTRLNAAGHYSDLGQVSRISVQTYFNFIFFKKCIVECSVKIV